MFKGNGNAQGIRYSIYVSLFQPKYGKKSTECSYFHVGKKLHKRIMPQLKYSHVQGELSEVQLNYG